MSKMDFEDLLKTIKNTGLSNAEDQRKSMMNIVCIAYLQSVITDDQMDKLFHEIINLT